MSQVFCDRRARCRSLWSRCVTYAEVDVNEPGSRCHLNYDERVRMGLQLGNKSLISTQIIMSSHANSHPIPQVASGEAADTMSRHASIIGHLNLKSLVSSANFCESLHLNLHHSRRIVSCGSNQPSQSS